jgi:hypothetical protein
MPRRLLCRICFDRKTVDAERHGAQMHSLREKDKRRASGCRRVTEGQVRRRSSRIAGRCGEGHSHSVSCLRRSSQWGRERQHLVCLFASEQFGPVEARRPNSRANSREVTEGGVEKAPSPCLCQYKLVRALLEKIVPGCCLQDNRLSY